MTIALPIDGQDAADLVTATIVIALENDDRALLAGALRDAHRLGANLEQMAAWLDTSTARVRELLATTTHYGRCRVRWHGRPCDARRAELLPNGYWRVDLVGGLVALYDEDPIANPDAHQRS